MVAKLRCQNVFAFAFLVSEWGCSRKTFDEAVLLNLMPKCVLFVAAIIALCLDTVRPLGKGLCRREERDLCQALLLPLLAT